MALLIVDFVALVMLVAWGRIEQVWERGDKMTTFAILFVFVIVNLAYVLQTPSDPNAKGPRFIRAFRKAWSDDQSNAS